MKKSKLILAVLLFAALILAGIVLPMLLRPGHAPSGKEPAKKAEAKDTQPLPTPEFIKFEDLTGFMAGTKVEELKSLFPAYLKEAGLSEISSVTFLSEEASYPRADEVKLVFQLSDKSKVPVSCDRDGRFLFGEEKQLLAEDTKTYKKEKDDTLPKVDASTVEKQQEGGYPDTASAPAKESGGK